jgi:NAD(P)-dependent dehydrogenase (short-subunit alcohol dehydrogenase family)
MGEIWRYEGKRVVVTGCASGMGQEAARELIELGAQVVGLDIAEPTVGVKEFHRLDLSDPASVDSVAAAIGGPIHALFNIAGISSGAAPPLKVAEVNILGTRRLTEALLPTMEAGSAVACVSSLAAAGYAGNIPTVQEFLAAGARGSGGVPRHDWGAGRDWLQANPDALGNGYNFAKQAIIVWVMQQGVELGKRGIRINCIGPTVTDTPFLADTIKTYGEGFIDAFPKPLGRVSRPEEQARALIFLNSDAASYITGQVLWTDGGYMGGVMTGLIKTGA